MFWGLTPCLDLIKEYKDLTRNNPLPDQINILLIGSTDCRHILKTLAGKYNHQKVQINFYVVEKCMETIAKQLLLLYIALQSQKSIGLDSKVKIFMELYGNTLIRPFTARYLYNIANDMVKMITNYEYLTTKMNGMVKINVKYSERDYLENVMKFWCSKDDFNIPEYWDKRLRKNLGARYDSKLGAFDWDLHMRLHIIGGRQICTQEYQSFRRNGIAFTWLESDPSLSNRSFVCAPTPNGNSYIHYGYLGEMETGPFVAYGLECDDKEFLKSQNGQNSYRATDVTERNLKQIFHEIEHQNKYEHIKINDMKLGCAIIKQEKLIFDKVAPEIVITEKIRNCFEIQNVNLNFFSISIFDRTVYSHKYRNYFDIIYFANNYVNHINKELINEIGKIGSILLIENQNFVLSNRKKELEIFSKNIRENIDDSKFRIIPQVDIEKDSYFKFVSLK